MQAGRVGPKRNLVACLDGGTVRQLDDNGFSAANINTGHHPFTKVFDQGCTAVLPDRALRTQLQILGVHAQGRGSGAGGHDHVARCRPHPRPSKRSSKRPSNRSFKRPIDDGHGGAADEACRPEPNPDLTICHHHGPRCFWW